MLADLFIDTAKHVDPSFIAGETDPILALLVAQLVAKHYAGTNAGRRGLDRAVLLQPAFLPAEAEGAQPGPVQGRVIADEARKIAAVLQVEQGTCGKHAGSKTGKFP